MLWQVPLTAWAYVSKTYFSYNQSVIDIRDKCVIMTSKRVNCDTCTYTQIQKPRPMDKCYLTCAIDFTNTQSSELLAYWILVVVRQWWLVAWRSVTVMIVAFVCWMLLKWFANDACRFMHLVLFNCCLNQQDYTATERVWERKCQRVILLATLTYATATTQRTGELLPQTDKNTK